MANKRQKKKNSKTVQTPKPQYQFPVGEKTLEAYNRQVKLTKAKFGRIEKKFGEDHREEVEREIQIPSLQDFSSRKQFNRWVEKVESFRNRQNQNYQFEKNEHGIVASKAQLKKVEKDTKQAQKLVDDINEEASKLPFFSGGKQQMSVAERAEQKKSKSPSGYIRPLDFNFDAITSYKQLNEKIENMEKKANGEYYDRRIEEMKKNFMEQLEHAFNSDADNIVTMINNIPPDDFYQMVLMFDEFTFEKVYINKGMSEEIIADYLAQMETYIEAYYNGEISMDLKNF